MQYFFIKVMKNVHPIYRHIKDRMSKAKNHFDDVQINGKVKNKKSSNNNNQYHSMFENTRKTN